MPNIFLRGLVLAGFLARIGQAQNAPDAIKQRDYSQLPLAFEKQSNERFLARGQGYIVGIEGRKVTIAAGSAKAAAVSLEFAGARAGQASAGPELEGKINEIHGNDPRQWRLGVSTYEKVKYAGVYPGIDVVYYGNQQQLEFDLAVQPGANPRAIRMKIRGARKIKLDASGALQIDDFKIALPKIYQEVNGTKKAVPGRYALHGDEVAFDVNDYDRSRRLVIDPTIVYSTLVSGGLNVNGSANGVGLDASGNILVAGSTGAADFPAVNAFQSALNGSENVFVSKINPAGTSLLYATFFGGSGTDRALGLAVDSAGAAWVTGYTTSTDFPLLNPTQSTLESGSVNAFVFRLDASGVPQFSTYLGSSTYVGPGVPGSDSVGEGVAVDRLNNGYVTGYHSQGSLPTTAGVVQPNPGGTFVAKYGPTGKQLYSRLLGGSFTTGYGIAVDSGGSAYITGITSDSTFPGMPSGGAQTTNNGNGDAFVAKLSPDASALVYFTFLGGAGSDQGNAIAVDASGNAYVGGYTGSTGLATPGAYQPTLNGEANGFAAELNASGSAFTYITYLGGNRNDSVQGLALDGSDNVYLAGITNSVSFPAVSAIQTTPLGLTSLYSSTNSAVSFSGADSTIPGVVRAFSINPSTGSEVALTDSGIYRSTDGGNKWTLSLQQEDMSLLARSPALPSTLYAIGPGGDFYSSTDDGVTWTADTGIPIYADGLIADPLNAGIVYVFSPNASVSLYVTTDGGHTWNPANTGLTGPVHAMAATTDGAVYAAADGIFKSTSQGGSWSEADRGIPAKTGFAENSLSASGTTVYAVGETSLSPLTTAVYTTTNGGAQWSALPGSIGAIEVAASPQNASVLYAFTTGNQVLASSDGGMTWSAPATGLAANVTAPVDLANFVVPRLFVDPQNSAHVLAVASAMDSGFVAKLAAGGGSLLWSTYLGGPTADSGAYGIATDGAGDAFVTGGSYGPGFPVTANALPSGPSGGFVTKIADATESCSTLTVSPVSASAPGTGGSITFTIVAPSGCAWTATSYAPWAVVTSGNAGTGTGTVTVQIPAYPEAPNRDSGGFALTVSVAGQAVTIEPSGGTTQPKTITFPAPANQAGDGADAGAGAPAVSRSVSAQEPGPAPTLMSSTNPSVFGQPVTLTATVPSGDTGTVTFYDGTNILGSAVVSNGSAVLSTIAIGQGRRKLSARYFGNLYLPAVSTTLNQTVTTNPGGGFKPGFSTPFVGGNGSNIVAVADFNHDSYPDIAQVDEASVLVYINNGNGTFQNAVVYPTNAQIYTISQISVADINLDGNPDLILTDGGNPPGTGTGSVYVLKNNGNGTFQSSTPLANVAGVNSIRIADVNSDGIPDIVGFNGAAILVCLGNGDGTFQTPMSAASSPIGEISDLEIGDFNGDGIPDAAVTSAGTSAGILFGTGTGSFTFAAIYPVMARIIAVADINNDGIPDIVGGAGPDNVLVGNADGSFSRPTTSAADNPLATSGIFAPTVTDADGDGNPDLMPGGQVGAAVYFGNGDGTFRAAVGINTGQGGFVTIGDFNGDGIVDLAATGGSLLSIYNGALAPRFTLTAAQNPVQAGQNVVLTVTSSHPDATGTLTLYSDSAPITMPLSNGSATFTITKPAFGDYSYYVNYSGNSQYAATSSNILAVTVEKSIAIKLTASPSPAYPGEQVTLKVTAVSAETGGTPVLFLDGVTPIGSAMFDATSTTSYTQTSFTTTFTAGTHQLRAEIPPYEGLAAASATFTLNVVSLPGGQFVTGASYQLGSTPTAMVAGDFTGDGLIDIAAVSASGQTLTLMAGTGYGIFVLVPPTPLDFVPGAMIAFTGGNASGQPAQLAITAPAQNAVYLFSCTTAATFSPPTQPGCAGSANYVGSQPVAVAEADFDSDGIPDLITANAGSDNVSAVLSSIGTIEIPAGTYPDAIVAADFNNDGNADFAVANRNDGTVATYQGNGDGTFQPAEITKGLDGTTGLATADLNGDGKPDLAVLDGASGQVTVLLGNGDGTFKALPPRAVPGATSITLMQSGASLTPSLTQSLVVTSSSGLLLFPGNGDGTFGTPVNYAQYAGATAVAAGAFLLDGSMNLAVAPPGSNSVSLLLNGAPATATLNASPTTTVLGKEVTFAINVTPATAEGWFTVYDGAVSIGSGFVFGGQGSFTTSLLLPGTHAVSAKFAGLGFGVATTSTINFTVTSLASSGFGWQPETFMYAPLNLVPGDFNNDGIEDFAFAYNAQGLGLLLGKSGSGTFTQVGAPFGIVPPMFAADLNRDGFTDIAYAYVTLGSLLNIGDGEFAQATGAINTLNVTPTAGAAADLNGDTIPDLVLATADGTLDVVPGVGDGTFQPARILPAGANPSAVAVADLNGDGIPDIVVANNISETSGAITVLSGQGGASFSAPQATLLGSGAISMALADFNGDHHLDAAVVSSNLITVLPGNGDGTFGAATTIPLPASPLKILAADMNGDGNQDLVVLFSSSSPVVAVFYGNGNGTFQPAATYNNTATPADIAIGDVNNDGRMDIAIASGSEDAPELDVFFGGATALTVIAGSPQSVPVNKVFTTLSVQAQKGALVTFTAPSSGPSGTFSGKPGVTVTAGSSGVATAPQFTANSTFGTYTVIASSAGFLDADFTLSNTGGTPASVTAEPANTTWYAGVGTAFQMPLQALVQDALGNPVPNVKVTFTAPASGASAAFPNGLTSATAETGSNGIATIIATANATQGSYQIAATVNALASAYFGMTNTPNGQVEITTALQAGQLNSGAETGPVFFVDGVSYTGSHIFNWNPGDPHTISAPSPQGTGQNSQLAFVSWSDGGPATHTYTVPASGGVLTVTFGLQYQVGVPQMTGGTITGGGFYSPGSVVTMTAVPDPGYVFQGFVASGGVGVPPGLSTSFSFTVNGPVTVSGTFTPLSALQSSGLYPVVSHTGNFYQGQIGATYSIVVTNGSSQSSDRTITVTEMPPAGLTLTSMSGQGWTCTGNVCTRSDTLLAGATYPPITAAVNVSQDAPVQLTNEVFCSNGIVSTSASLGVPATDLTTIDPAATAQTISFPALPNLAQGAPSFNLTATASSGLAVSYLSQSPGVCTVSGSTLTIVGTGICSVTASQAGNASYAAASPVTQSFTVDIPAIVFDAIPSQVFGVSPFAIAAQANTFLPVTIASTTPTVCTTAGILVTLLKPGTCSITASQPGNGTYAASTPVTQTFTINQANPSGTLTQAPGSPIPVAPAGPATANAVAAGDFNGDGIPDLAVVVENLVNPNTVAVLLGDGQGGFTPAAGSPFSIGGDDSVADAITAGDFNGDGVQDLAVANQMSGNIALLLGNGQGGFTPAQGSPFAVGAGPYSIVTGDFNGDGIQDLATANYFDGDVSILLGNGSGGFNQATGSPIMTGSGTAGVAVADLNGDGIQDLAVTIQASPSVVIALIGNGSGGFTPSSGSPFTVGSWPRSIAVGDFNGDGIPDVATANSNDNDVTVLLGDGTGNFNAAMNSPFPTGKSPISVLVADFNGDGIPDLAVSNSTDGDVTLLLGNGSGNFTAAGGSPFGVGQDPLQMSVGDFNHDGIEDLAVPNGQTVTILLGAASATGGVLSTTSPSSIPLGQSVPLSLTLSGTSFNPLTGTATFKDGTKVLGTATETASPFTFTATGLALGMHSLTATFNGSSGSAAFTSNAITINVLKAQTITFGALANRTMGTGPFPLTATASSGLTVTFASNTPSICTVSGDNVKLVAEGTCSITASQAGNTTYVPAAPVTQVFSIAGEPQTINFTAPAKQTMGAAPFALKATATSKLTVTFASNSRAVCTVSGVTVTLVEAGTCSITASQPGNPAWAAATPVTQTFTVAGEAQIIKFGALTSQTLGTGPVALSATATSGLTVTFASTSPAVCTVSGASVTLVAQGTCSITASQPGDSTYAAASPVTQTFKVLESQTITFGALSTQLVGTKPPALSATASSGLAVKYTSNSPNICTVTGVNVTLVSGGTCSITASQAGNSIYAAAPSVTQTFAVYNTQTIKFTAPAGRTLGAAPFALSATASSGLAVTFESNSLAVCTVSGVNITLTAAGTCSITASQAGNSIYAAATPVTQTFTVAPEPQTITFGALSSQGLGTGPLALSATASSGLVVTFSSNSQSVCTVSGASVTLVAAGTCSITASQPGNSNWAAAAPVTHAFAIETAQTIVLFDPINNTQFTNSTTLASVALTASASSGLPVVFTSLTTSVCTVSKAVVTLVAPGTCTIMASQPGNSIYAAAPPLTQSFTSLSTGPPQMMSLTAGNRSANSQTFSIWMRDYNGVTDLQTITLLFSNGNNTTAASACQAAYLPASNSLVLYNDAGTGFVTGSVKPGGTNSVSNSQCTLSSGGAISVTGVLQKDTIATNITVPFHITAASGFTGYKWVFASGQNNEGQNTGWQAQGFWRPIRGADSQTALNSSGTPSVLGSAVTLTATVTPSSVTGTVTFYDGTTVLGMSPISSGTATLTTSLLAAGSRSLTARYSGSDTLAPSLSPAFHQNVTANLGGGFAPYAGVAGGYNSFTIADFNGDGKPDIATDAGSGVYIYFGKGDGTFPQWINPISGSGLLATADFNGDGITDLLLYSEGEAGVALGEGGGAFQTPVPQHFSGSPPLVLADLNNDGWVDAMAFNALLLGNGDGTLQLLTGSQLANVPLVPLAVGDFNGDGNADLAVAVSGGVAIALGNGDGTFNPAGPVVAPGCGGFGSGPMIVDDLNGDGISDMVMACGSAVGVVLGGGKGSFVSAPTAGTLVSAAVSDFNGDGKMDIVLAGYTESVAYDYAGYVDVFSGNGDGTFQAPVSYNAGAQPLSVAVGDFNGDGIADVMVLDAVRQTVFLMQGLPGQIITFQPIANVVNGATSVVLSATTTSGLPITFVSNTTSVCTVSGTTVSILSTGTCSITATQPGNGVIGSASPVTQTFTIQEPQTISFGPLSNQSLSTGSITLSATASSGLPVTFSTNTPDVCTISGVRVKLWEMGLCWIFARQAGNSTYVPAGAEAGFNVVD